MTQASHVDDASVQKKWQELAPLIDRMMQRTDTPGEFPVRAGSSLAGDDRAADPYHVSHMLGMCLTAGVDHLHAVKALVVDLGVLHVAAPSSLARGALENFAAAYWILGPERRRERVERALRWYAKNIKDGNRAASPLDLPGQRTLEEKLQKLDAVVERCGLDPRSVRRGYTSTEVVKYAEENAPNLNLGVLLPWQISSGFAHGRPWAYLGVSEREEDPTESPNIKSVRLTSDLTRALYPTLAAMHLLERFLQLYEARSNCALV